jgi:hypothetical protein
MSDQIAISWELLKQLGLDITPHSDPTHGWGYTWQGRDWVGPFTSPAAALHAAFTEALLALQFRNKYSWADLAQPGDLWLCWLLGPSLENKVL